MENLLLHISYLIERHDCVVIPGIGAFLGHSQSAKFNAEEGILYPPCREISFNGDITFDDGLLVSSYARRQSINYTSALEAVRCDVALLSDTLQEGGEVTISHLGQLKINNQGNYIFTPVTKSLYSSCFSPIKISGNVEEVSSDASNVVVLPSPSRFNRLMHGALKYAAMLVFMISIALVFSTPIVDDAEYEVVKANMCPFTVADNIDTDIVPQFFIALPSEHAEEAQEDAISEDTEVLNNYPYVLIIASLANEAQADKFIAEAGDDAKGIINVNGRYRVYGATGDSPATLMKSPLLERYPDAWPMAVDKN